MGWPAHGPGGRAAGRPQGILRVRVPVIVVNSSAMRCAPLRQVLTFRTGRTEANGGKPPADYGCGVDGSDTECTAFEFAGALAVAGTPYFVGTTNVN